MKKRTWITFFMIVISTSLITSLVVIGFQRYEYFKNMEVKTEETVLFLKDILENSQPMNEEELVKDINQYSELLGVKITLTLKDGKQIVSHKKTYKNESELEELFIEKTPIVSQHIKGAEVAVYHTDLNETNKQIWKYILISMVASLIVVLIMGTRYMEHAIKPYNELTNATQNIINGIYDEKLTFYDDEDLDYLAKNFNLMSRKLQKTIKELQDANTKLKATLISIRDGVIAFDNDLNTILINPFAEKIIGMKEEQIMGKHISKIFKDEDLKETFLSLIEKGHNNELEVELNKSISKIINVNVNTITSHKNPMRKFGTVFVMQDITKIKKLERIREDFVANVSHELKTPLTSLKGFVETLNEGAIENKEIAYKFLNIMDVEVNRLNSLTNDLLLLSEVENRKLDLINEIIYIDEVVDDVFEFLNKSARDKDISLIKQIVDNPLTIQGNYNYFKQMLINLIDNGIKYTPKGGSVKVWAKEEKGNLTIKVMDTGIGIEKDQYERLFERFYRVDRSRSRQVEGTGLGLAIVKHVISIFNGIISVESEPNCGTTFTIKIPIDIM